MNWIYLFIAGILEIVWIIGLKYSAGFNNLWPSVITVIAMIFSTIFISLAVREIPIGNAYIIWVGIGSVGAAIAGIFLFKESTELLRIVFLSLTLIGIAGLSIFK